MCSQEEKESRYHHRITTNARSEAVLDFLSDCDEEEKAKADAMHEEDDSIVFRVAAAAVTSKVVRPLDVSGIQAVEKKCFAFGSSKEEYEAPSVTRSPVGECIILTKNQKKDKVSSIFAKGRRRNNCGKGHFYERRAAARQPRSISNISVEVSKPVLLSSPYLV